MPLSSAERFRTFKAKLKFEKTNLYLKKFPEKDATAHRKSRQMIKQEQDPIKMAKIREQNRAR
jgi:hypothetical protein